MTKTEDKNKIIDKIKTLTDRIEQNQDSADLYWERGLLFRVLEEYQKAIDDYSTVIQNIPNSPQLWKIYHERSNAYQKIGKLDESFEDLIKTDLLGNDKYLLFKGEKTPAKSWYEYDFSELGDYFKKNGNYRKAILCFEKLKSMITCSEETSIWHPERFPQQLIYGKGEGRWADIFYPWHELVCLYFKTGDDVKAYSNLKEIQNFYSSSVADIIDQISIRHLLPVLDIVFTLKDNLEKSPTLRSCLNFLKSLSSEVDKDIIDKKRLTRFVIQNGRFYSVLKEFPELTNAIFNQELNEKLRISPIDHSISMSELDAVTENNQKIKSKKPKLVPDIQEAIRNFEKVRENPLYDLRLKTIIINFLFELLSGYLVNLISDFKNNKGEFISELEQSALEVIKSYQNNYAINCLYGLSRNMNKLLQENISAIENKDKLEQEANHRREKERMIQQYSHTLANTLYPNAIYEVANRLKSHIEFRRDARILTDAYLAETIIRNQGLLLQARNTGNPAEFQYLIRGDRLPEDAQEKAIGIEEILNGSVQRIIARFLNADDRKLGLIRPQVCTRRGTTLDQLKADFEENVFFNPNRSAIEWASANLGQIEYTLSPLWKSIRLRRDGYAEALLQGYFQELLFNSLKYRDIAQDIWIRIDFSDEKIDDTTWLIAKWENPFADKKTIQLGTGKGLEGIENDIRMLNLDGERQARTLEIQKNAGLFNVTIHFRNDLFVPNPPIETDREKLAKVLSKERAKK